MRAGNASFSLATKAKDGKTEQLSILQTGEHGFTLKDFLLGPELGRGEGGGVRIAAHRPTKVRYALKEISIGAQATRHQLAKELQMQKNCRMPYIVQLHDAFYEEGRVYLVLELMDWGSLERLLEAQLDATPARGGMDEGVLAVITHRIMSAICYLQEEHRIIHRDLKPGNVVMSSSGHVKLSDFGVSRVLDNDAKGLSWVGTASYMSPERLQGWDYTHKADVWSIGIITLECALGKHPYMPPEGNLAFFELMQVVVVDPVPIPHDQGLSQVFIEFVGHCLAKQESKRLSTRELLHHPYLMMHIHKVRFCFCDMPQVGAYLAALSRRILGLM